MPTRGQLVKLIKRHYRAVARIEKGSYSNITMALVKHYTSITALELTLARLDSEDTKDPPAHTPSPTHQRQSPLRQCSGVGF